MTNDVKADSILDCTGLLCPMPVVKTKLAIDDMEPGQVLKIISTDAGAQKDFPAYCSETGHKLLKAAEDHGKFTFYIEKAKGDKQ